MSFKTAFYSTCNHVEGIQQQRLTWRDHCCAELKGELGNCVHPPWPAALEVEISWVKVLTGQWNGNDSMPWRSPRWYIWKLWNLWAHRLRWQIPFFKNFLVTSEIRIRFTFLIPLIHGRQHHEYSKVQTTQIFKKSKFIWLALPSESCNKLGSINQDVAMFLSSWKWELTISYIIISTKYNI